jgi:hypothetical protein
MAKRSTQLVLGQFPFASRAFFRRPSSDYAQEQRAYLPAPYLSATAPPNELR